MFKVGDRVELTREVWRYPHFAAPAGLAGLVVAVADDGGDLFAVRMDEPLPGAEEWSNEIHWFDGDDPADDLRLIDG